MFLQFLCPCGGAIGRVQFKGGRGISKFGKLCHGQYELKTKNISQWCTIGTVR